MPFFNIIPTLPHRYLALPQNGMPKESVATRVNQCHLESIVRYTKPPNAIIYADNCAHSYVTFDGWCLVLAVCCLLYCCIAVLQRVCIVLCILTGSARLARSKEWNPLLARQRLVASTLATFSPSQ